MVIDRDFTEVFTPGINMTTALKQAIGKKAQKVIDSYKERKELYDSVVYNTGVSQIDSGLTL